MIAFSNWKLCTLYTATLPATPDLCLLHRPFFKIFHYGCVLWDCSLAPEDRYHLKKSYTFAIFDLRCIKVRHQRQKYTKMEADVVIHYTVINNFAAMHDVSNPKRRVTMHRGRVCIPLLFQAHVTHYTTVWINPWKYTIVMAEKLLITLYNITSGQLCMNIVYSLLLIS